MFPIQRVNTSFAFLLLLETKMPILDCPLTIIGFIYWVGCKSVKDYSFVHPIWFLYNLGGNDFFLLIIFKSLF